LEAGDFLRFFILDRPTKADCAVTANSNPSRLCTTRLRWPMRLARMK
jgi:hypothetical protein